MHRTRWNQIKQGLIDELEGEDIPGSLNIKEVIAEIEADLYITDEEDN